MNWGECYECEADLTTSKVIIVAEEEDEGEIE